MKLWEKKEIDEAISKDNCLPILTGIYKEEMNEACSGQHIYGY